MHIKDIDLNLLRLFEAVHRLGSVSRAAEALDLSQPAASQALARLRLLLGDALFVRAPAACGRLRGPSGCHAPCMAPSKCWKRH